MKSGAHTDWIDLLRRLAPLLPAELFDQLRTVHSPAVLSERIEKREDFADSLRQAISSLDTLHHTLTTFLPRYLLDSAPTPGQPCGELLEGSFIFADVTGFTTLTGALSRRGTEGREMMNRLMRELFAALLDPLLVSGGDLLIFAGDAVLACFPAQSGGQDARWATRAALRVIEAIAPFADLQTSHGTFSLTMSVGVERGQALAAFVGTKRRMELLISGGPVQGAMAAEGEARPGEVIAGAGIRPYLHPEEFSLRGRVVEGIEGGELSDYEPVPPARRRRRISALFSRRVPDLIRYTEQALADVEALVPFIPPDLFGQIARGEDIRQHPPVAVQFVNVLGIEDVALKEADPERAAAILQRYFLQAQQIVSDREGIISQVDPYARGFTLLNPFGVPKHHEGVPRLAASAALELGRALERVNREFGLDPPLVQRMGLTYDRIFTGEIGYRHRREYVVAGPAVNLTARLMSKAQHGEVVLGPTIWESVRQDFVADPQPPVSLKGISEPVPRFLLQGVREGRGRHVADHPLVGRQRERAVLEALMTEAVAGRGGALALFGEAGLGKNHLAAAIADRAVRQGMTVLTGHCHPFTQASPYHPWIDLIRGWFELDDANPALRKGSAAPHAVDRRHRLRENLARFDLTSSLPAFADLLGLPTANPTSRTSDSSVQEGAGLFGVLTRETEGREADTGDWTTLLTRRAAQGKTTLRTKADFSIWEVLRERASIPQALHLLLERQAFEDPTLVLIEDIQWMDADSRDVLETIAASAHRWSLLLLVTARPGIDWRGDRLLLLPLSDDDSRALAALGLRADRLAPDLASWLLSRSAGNPLFILSYCRALRDAEAVVVDPGSDEARWSGPPPSLPLSLQELMLAEVDRLGWSVRKTLQRSAVVGTTFSIELLHCLCRDVLSPAQLSEALDQSARRSLVIPPPPAPAYTFGSQSLHDAVYSTLSHAQRRAWHGKLGDYLARGDEVTRYERLERIAHHYSRSDNACGAAHFNRLAGDKARARQADEAALTFYDRVLDVVDGECVAVEYCRAHEGLGDIHALRGDREAAYDDYQRALQDAPPPDAHRLTAKLAMLVPLFISKDMLTKPTEVSARLDRAYEMLPPTHSLRSWLGAARVWILAENLEAVTAALKQELHLTDSKPVRALLEDALEDLDKGEPLPSYDKLFDIFARTQLRCLPAGE